MHFGIEFVFWKPWEPLFWVFRALKTDLKMKRFLVMKRILSSGSGGGDPPEPKSCAAVAAGVGVPRKGDFPGPLEH